MSTSSIEVTAVAGVPSTSGVPVATGDPDPPALGVPAGGDAPGEGAGVPVPPGSGVLVATAAAVADGMGDPVSGEAVAGDGLVVVGEPLAG